MLLKMRTQLWLFTRFLCLWPLCESVRGSVENQDGVMLTVNLTHLGRGCLGGKRTSISFPCGYVCETFSSVFIDTEGPAHSGHLKRVGPWLCKKDGCR